MDDDPNESNETDDESDQFNESNNKLAQYMMINKVNLL